MKRLLIGCLLLIGCAHKTQYERCSENDLYLRYGSMQQCMAELPRQRSFSEGFRDGWNSMDRKTMNCRPGLLPNQMECN